MEEGYLFPQQFLWWFSFFLSPRFWKSDGNIMNASIRPSGQLSVHMQTHVQMSADKRRDEDGVPVSMK